MKTIIAILPLSAALAFSQVSRTETKTTTWNGTLVDATCQTTQTQRTTQDATKTETTKTETVHCPVTVKTTTFGIITPTGQFIRFDNPSNTKVIEIVKTQKVAGSPEPLRVHVVGMADGETTVVQTVSFADPSTQVERTGSAHADISLDVRYDGDRGKLLVSDKGISFENVSDARRSKTWTYGQIQEFKRESNNRVTIEPFDDDEYEFQLDGPMLADATYKLISDRIVAARGR